MGLPIKLTLIFMMHQEEKFFKINGVQIIE